MTLNEYQEKTSATVSYETPCNSAGVPSWVYTVLGLNGEAGEVAEVCKKLLRDKQGVIDEEFLTQLNKELGDVLWYVSETAKKFGFTLEEIAQTNVDKIQGREVRGTIHGDGDNR